MPLKLIASQLSRDSRKAPSLLARSTGKAWRHAGPRPVGAHPVFIQLTGASFGFQAGGQSTDLVLVGVNRRSLDDLLKDKVKLGGDIAAAAGPVGRDSQASTTELANAEFLTYSRSRGLFAGVDLTGDEVHQNTADTEAYYGKDIPYKTILSGAVPTPPSAHHFVATVNEMFRRGRSDTAKRKAVRQRVCFHGAFPQEKPRHSEAG